MGLDSLPRQIIFGDDDARRFALGPRQRLERILPRRAGAQIDAGEPFRGRLHIRSPKHAFASRVADESLGLQRRAAGVITRHSLEYLNKLVRVVSGLYTAGQRVTAVAAEQKFLSVVRAGHAREPFRV